MNDTFDTTLSDHPSPRAHTPSRYLIATPNINLKILPGSKIIASQIKVNTARALLVRGERFVQVRAAVMSNRENSCDRRPVNDITVEGRPKRAGWPYHPPGSDNSPAAGETDLSFCSDLSSLTSTGSRRRGGGCSGDGVSAAVSVAASSVARGVTEVTRSTSGSSRRRSRQKGTNRNRSPSSVPAAAVPVKDSPSIAKDHDGTSEDPVVLLSSSDEEGGNNSAIDEDDSDSDDIKDSEKDAEKAATPAEIAAISGRPIEADNSLHSSNSGDNAAEDDCAKTATAASKGGEVENDSSGGEDSSNADKLPNGKDGAPVGLLGCEIQVLWPDETEWLSKPERTKFHQHEGDSGGKCVVEWRNTNTSDWSGVAVIASWRKFLTRNRSRQSTARYGYTSAPVELETKSKKRKHSSKKKHSSPDNAARSKRSSSLSVASRAKSCGTGTAASLAEDGRRGGRWKRGIKHSELPPKMEIFWAKDGQWWSLDRKTTVFTFKRNSDDPNSGTCKVRYQNQNRMERLSWRTTDDNTDQSSSSGESLQPIKKPGDSFKIQVRWDEGTDSWEFVDEYTDFYAWEESEDNADEGTCTVAYTKVAQQRKRRKTVWKRIDRKRERKPVDRLSCSFRREDIESDDNSEDDGTYVHANPWGLLELGSGSGVLSETARMDGFETTTVDHDKSKRADVCASFAELRAAIDSGETQKFEMLNETYDIIWCAPNCSTWSVAAGGKYRNKGHIDGFPKGDPDAFRAAQAAAQEIRDLVAICLHFQAKNPNVLICFENPQALLQYHPVTKTKAFKDELQLTKLALSYCMFRETGAKPTPRKHTNIWTNGSEIRKVFGNDFYCNKDCTGMQHCGHKHQSGVYDDPGRFAIYPKRLREMLLSCFRKEMLKRHKRCNKSP